MITRRTFLKVSSAGALTLYALNEFGVEEAIAAAIPGGTLLPGAIAKFVTPLVIPPAMLNTGTANEYSIAVRQFTQQILPSGMPPTTVWSYGATNNLAGTLNYPAFTIEATRSLQTTITWVNGLVDGSNNFLSHLLPVDPTLHWANPPGGNTGRDTRPIPPTTPGPYTGPVPIVTHVHGMEGVSDWSDGYAEAWFLPAAGNIPTGFATVGTWYDFFKTKSGLDWATGTAKFKYPNTQRPSTAWYHDHTLGMTRLNVYAGPAGFYIIRSTDPADEPTMTAGGPAVLPGPAPQLGDAPGTTYYEIPIAIQDRSFDLGGSLFYPNTRGVLRRIHRAVHPDDRRLADLEPRVLRQLHGRQREDLAVSQRRAAALPLPAAKRLPIALPAPEVQRPESPGLADRERGGLPPRARTAHADPDESGRARRHHRRLLPRQVRTERDAAERRARTRRSPAAASAGPTRSRRGSSCAST